MADFQQHVVEELQKEVAHIDASGNGVQKKAEHAPGDGTRQKQPAITPAVPRAIDRKALAAALDDVLL